MTIPVIEEIQMCLEQITDEDMGRAARSMREVQEGEQVLGIIDDPVSQRIWTLGFMWAGESNKFKNKSVYDAVDSKESSELNIEAERYRELSDLCREIFWSSCRALLRGEAWAAEGIGIRAGFTLVKESKRPSNALQAILGPFSAPE